MDSYQSEDDFLMNDAVEKWRTLTANDRILLEKEFQNLRKFDPKRAIIAVNPKNKSKNRYGSVYPYDEDFCRVCLDKKESPDQSDYINASIIRSIPHNQISSSSTSKFFYVAQGPTEHTLDNFIRMIVEQQITAIAMLSFPHDPITLTYAEEHVPYFSDKSYGVIETKSYKISTILILSGYRCISRRLRIKSKLNDTAHICEQYHYTHFVDKSVPTDYHSLIGLVKRTLEINNQKQRILIHCSAGIGRSGVFIALCYLLEAIELHQILNVKQLVDTMRLYRPHLVQTCEQYEYIYRCLAEIAIHPYDVRLLEQFLEYSNKLLPTARHKDSPIYSNFENRANRVELDTYLTTVDAEQYAYCNRNKLFIPYDQNRVYLHSPSEAMYINASKLTNLSESGGIILTQEPMKTTLQPFFAMLLQEHKIFVVAVEEMEKPNYAEGKFFGRNEINVDILNVGQSKNKFGSYQRSYKIKVKQSNIRESDVFIFEYMGEWTNDDVCLPRNLEQFVRFVDRSIYHQRKIDPTRLGLVVHDREGGSKAAFYCIVQNLFDRLLVDNRISIENFVTNICQQRMNALVSLEQYIALYEIVNIWYKLKRRGALECTVNNDYI